MAPVKKGAYFADQTKAVCDMSLVIGKHKTSEPVDEGEQAQPDSFDELKFWQYQMTIKEVWNVSYDD